MTAYLLFSPLLLCFSLPQLSLSCFQFCLRLHILCSSSALSCSALPLLSCNPAALLIQPCSVKLGAVGFARAGCAEWRHWCSSDKSSSGPPLLLSISLVVAAYPSVQAAPIVTNSASDIQITFLLLTVQSFVLLLVISRRWTSRVHASLL